MTIRKHWSAYDKDKTVYGTHRYGIGVYRFDKNYKNIEWWLDYESATPEEIKRYRKYLRKRKLWKELKRKSLEETLIHRIKQIKKKINTKQKAIEFLASTGAYTQTGRLKKKWR